MTWPWTNLTKELQKRLEEAKDESKLIPAEDVFEWLRNRPKQNWFVVKWNNFRYGVNLKVWQVYHWFKPHHKTIRNSIPKHWVDLDEVIRQVNFAAVVEFYEQEYQGYVKDDMFPDRDRQAYEFHIWLKDAYQYITTNRPKLAEAIYDPVCWDCVDIDERSKCYDNMHLKEQELDNLDTKFLKDIVEKRALFWT